MTDEILKKIDEKIRQQQKTNAHYGLDITDGLETLKALREAVTVLSGLASNRDEQGAHCFRCLQNIATHLGIEVESSYDR